jgi:hypothetical protein
MLSNFLSRFSRTKSTPEPVYIISGLPRSGTSMMMQILQAGGLEVLTDHVRTADEDNPKGYYEFERVKKLKDGDTHWVKEAQGKVVKIISALLEYLPKDQNYKTIFMLRDFDEILASQKQMLIRRGEPTDKVSDEALSATFQKHLSAVKTWLAQQQNMEVFFANYKDLLQNPEPFLVEVVAFLDIPLDKQAMLEIPDRKLYRQRA